ncbi:MAG: LacI family DNA-binding transcriptional regulator [Lachnospiraceae bacterium]|nr:LacI family DNA-binding transcriptional regulator [Lachnospiraceae bacterium]
MVSMKDISAVCGVSIATVSKALNDHRDIGEETKEHIRQVAKELGYSPNSAAKTLKTNRTYSLGVLFVDDEQSGLTHDYFAHVLDSFKRTAEERGYDITFINSCKTRPQRMSYLEHSRYRRFDGVVIACVDFEDPEVEELVRSNIPVVTIDHLFNNRSTIVSDNVKGISDLVHYIYEMGHRKIAYIHGADSAVTQSRLSSFYRTCEELGLEIPSDYVREAPYRNTKDTYAETVKLLDLKDPPTCIIYPDDFSCFGGINAIYARGLKIPDDVSVAGYDGIRIARHYRPQLTTIVQDTKRLGREAAIKLIDLIENPKTTLTEQIVVTGEVFPGESVAKIN